MPAKPSATAQLAALARAVAHLEREERRGPDHLAREFLDPPFALILHAPFRWMARWFYARRMPGAYGYVMARSHCFDDFVRAELGSGATQLVILGAGYDSRAYRFRTQLAKARVFELDAQPMSELKQGKVRRLFGELPPWVRYVPVDFEADGIAEPLIASGYDPGQRTAFICEAVTFYLSSEAVDRILAFVAGRTGAGSAILFDYLFRDVVDGGATEFGASAAASYVKRKGEPFQFGLTPDSVASFVSGRGIHLESNRLPEDLQRAYLSAQKRGSDTYRVGGYYGIALGRVRE